MVKMVSFAVAYGGWGWFDALETTASSPHPQIEHTHLFALSHSLVYVSISPLIKQAHIEHIMGARYIVETQCPLLHLGS